jgi:hypothetical protein
MKAEFLNVSRLSTTPLSTTSGSTSLPKIQIFPPRLHTICRLFASRKNVKGEKDSLACVLYHPQTMRGTFTTRFSPWHPEDVNTNFSRKLSSSSEGVLN